MSKAASDRARDLFLEVVELPKDQRAEAVRQRCAGDEPVRREIEALLASHDRAGRFLQGPEGGPTPRQIGPYELIEPLGEGAWGVVWLARQAGPTPRKVAVKLLRPEVWRFVDGSPGGVGARFALEQRALARMEHPGIARLIEAGVHDVGHGAGQQYLVMEFIDGRPITAFCDEHVLDLRDRVSLLARVCDAVHHAHTKGVLHRDLKPRNVLVASPSSEEPADAQPRVIDFGIARLLDPSDRDLELTGLGVVVGTPQYMSPEQSMGEAVDARTDIFALGVVLYELLCGTTPLPASVFSGTSPSSVWHKREARALPAMVGALSELAQDQREALAKSRGLTAGQLESRLRGELEWIVGKALSIEPERRYASAAAMAEDLRRWLVAKPIDAAPPHAGYQLRKFASRHRAAVVAGAAALVVLVAGLATTTTGFVLAVENAKLAELQTGEARRQAAVAHAVSAFLTDDVLGAIGPSTRPGEGRGVTMEEVLRVSADELTRATAPGGRLASEPEVAAALWRALGRSSSRIDRHEDAFRALGRAIALREAELGPTHPDTLAMRSELGEAYLMAQRLDEAEEVLVHASESLVPLVGLDDPRVIRAHGWLASTYRRQGQMEQALQLSQSVYGRARRVLGPDDPFTYDIENGLGWTLSAAGEGSEAVELLRGLLERQRAQRSANHAATLVTQQNLASVLLENKWFEQAEAEFADLAPRLDEVFGADHQIAIGVWANTATLRSRIGREAEALEIVQRIGPIARENLGDASPVTLYIERLEGQIASNLGDHARALEVFERLRPRYEDLHGPEHPSTLILLNDIGLAHMGVEDPHSAYEVFGRLVAVYESTLMGHHRLLVSVRQNYAEACMGVEAWEEAQQQYRLLAEATRGDQGADAYLPNVLFARQALVLAMAGEDGNARSVLDGIDGSALEGAQAAELAAMIAVVEATMLAAAGRAEEARIMAETALESMEAFDEDDPILQHARALRDGPAGRG